jgi:hypothetical protein
MLVASLRPAQPKRLTPAFIIRDNNGQALSYVYYENEPGRRTAAGLLTCDEARRIAINMTQLPELLRKLTSTADLLPGLPASV